MKHLQTAQPLSEPDNRKHLGTRIRQRHPDHQPITANTQDPPPAYPFSSHYNVKQQNGARLDPSRTRQDRPPAPQRSGLIRAAPHPVNACYRDKSDRESTPEMP